MLSQKYQHKILSHFPNVPYNVVGIAASAGGLSAISTILSALPPDFPAAIVLVQHLYYNSPSCMADLLSQQTALRVKQAQDGELLRPGTVYTPVPDRHTLVNPRGTLSLSDSPKVNFTRPAADKLFWSLADSYQSRAIAVVLTGKNSDGALGIIAIKKHGGTVIVQDETTSQYFTMPKAAIETKKVDYILPLEKIALSLMDLVMAEKVTDLKLG